MIWQKLLTRENVDLTTISGIDLVFYKHVWNFTKTKDELFFTLFKNKGFTHFIGINPQELGRHLYKKFFNTPEQIENYYKEGLDLLEQIEKSTKKWKKLKASDKELLNIYREFKRQFEIINHIYCVTSWLAIETWQDDFDKILSSLIKKRKLEKKQEQITFSAYKPWKKTAIYEIQDKIKSGESLKNLVSEYQFLRSWSVIWYRPIDETWIRNLKKSPVGIRIKRSYSFKELVHLLKPNPKEKHFLKMAPYIVFFKDWRDDLRRNHVYNWSFFFEILAKKLGINYDDLGYLTLDEIENCLQAKLDKKIIEKRKKRPCIATVIDAKLKIRVIDEKIPQRYKDIIKSIESKRKEIIIKGLVARKGKATGNVRIIRSYHDLKKFEKDEILVANTTHPDYLPAMQKAAAFITNEGGMLSHAAIASRELGTPCIVGTGNATKILKDGDRVEVDANKGIVRKIK